MSKFITNQSELLSDVANDILPSTETLKFLVGYFYFSGFKEIYENVEDKNMKILVGLTAEPGISNSVNEINSLGFTVTDKKSKDSDRTIKEKHFSSLKRVINRSDLLEDEDARNAFEIFVQKIANGTLEIKKTRDPNHAKMYVFEKSADSSEGGQYPGVVVTGSSNLSVSGLKDNFEINVEIRDRDRFEEADEIFENLWNTAVPIVSQENFDEFEEKVVNNIWVDKVEKPYLIYVRVLWEYFSGEDSQDITPPSKIHDDYMDLQYQLDAVKDGLESVKRHGGAIIADVVGLGKSVIASVIANNLDLRTVVIAPPHLTDQWEEYLYKFDITGDVMSSGKTEAAYKKFNNDLDQLIIIDEAHSYRNEDNIDYGNLHKLCQGNQVLLLSATPFNNRPEDIFSLVKLFQIPGRSTIRTVSSLSHRFRGLIKRYSKVTKSQREDKDTDTGKYQKQINQITRQIKSILDPVIIRRSRLDLENREKYKKDLERQGIEFPEVHPPIEHDYVLGDLEDRYGETLEKLAITKKNEGFIGARYKPTIYVQNFNAYKARLEKEYGTTENIKQAQENNATFMKRLLIRRFESSIPAFFSTLGTIQEKTEEMLRWLEDRGEVPIYKEGNIPDLTRFENTTGESIDAALEEKIEELKEDGMRMIKGSELKENFKKDLESDIALLKEIKKMWEDVNAGITPDPKLVSLKELLDKKLEESPDRKIIIFTEYNDTANYLEQGLAEDFSVFKYSSADASKQNKRTIKENFDASVTSRDRADDYDILVATDAISEGYNLNRAGIVFNYDIPYNPTRIIQRVGRINRVNKKVFDDLYIYNSFPSATGEEETRTKQIATLKMSMIQALLGEDTQFLTSDEEPRMYNQQMERGFKEYQDETKEELEESEESWDTPHKNILDSVESNQPQLLQKAKDMPQRIRIGRKITKDVSAGVLLSTKKGDDFSFGFKSFDKKDITVLPAEEAFKLLSADKDEPGFSESSDFDPAYKKLRAEIFQQDHHVQDDKTVGEALNMIGGLQDRDEFADNDVYFKDLKYVIDELDSLPNRYKKLILSLDWSDDAMEASFEGLKSEVPHNYLETLIKTAKEIEEGEEQVIVSEEFSHGF